eukprot:GHVP01053367.1.p1 GENE.GHVP01053367.1~~GHVP01053367.1.p1  ORF type:complete len:465 (-),score=65.04 GHVP01053367.1:848-2242(-)
MLDENIKSTIKSKKDLFYTKITAESDKNIQKVIAKNIRKRLDKTIRRIDKNTLKIRSVRGNLTSLKEDKIRDQGFTRPSILVLCPYMMRSAITLKRLMRGRKIIRKSRMVTELKEKMLNDDFVVCVKVKQKQIRLYTKVQKADVIFASPKGLMRLISEEKTVSDFLSSIETLYIDRAETIMMQNWNNLDSIMELICKLPKKIHSVDINRIKEIFLDMKGRENLNTILTSTVEFPEINKIKRQSLNKEGIESFRIDTIDQISHVVEEIPKLFLSFDSISLDTCQENRHRFLVKSIEDKDNQLYIPSINRRKGERLKTVCIFTSDSDESVALKEYFKTRKYTVLAITDNSTDKEASNAVLKLYKREVQILIITERFCFYSDIPSGFCDLLIVYSLPIIPDTLKTLCSQLFEVSNKSSIVLLFCKYDLIKVRSLLGKEKTDKLFRKKVLLISKKSDILTWRYGRNSI